MSAKRFRILLNTLTREELANFEHQLKYQKKDKEFTVFKFFQTQITKSTSTNSASQVAIFLNKTGLSNSYWKLLIQGLILKVEDFLITQSLAKSPKLRSSLLREVYRKKSADDLLLQTIQKAKKTAQKEHFRSNDLIHNYWLSREELDFLSIKTPRKISIQNSLDCLAQLDSYYIIQRIKLMMEITLWNIYSPQRKLDDIPLYSEIMHLLNEHQFENEILFNLYKIAFKLLTKQTDDYELLSSLLKEQIENLDKEDLFYIYTFLINFHITQKSSDNAHLERVFELYKEMIHYGFLEIQNYIPPGKFKNVVTTACIFKEFNWALQFIKNSQAMIEPKFRESVVQFNYGVVYFYQNNLELAQDALRKVEYVNIFYALDSKSLLSRVYFEKGEFFALIRFLSSFKDFVRKHSSLSRVMKERYSNYIKMLKQITNTKQLVVSKQYKEKLLDKLANQSVIYYRDWLSQKIMEL